MKNYLIAPAMLLVLCIAVFSCTSDRDGRSRSQKKGGIVCENYTAVQSGEYGNHRGEDSKQFLGYDFYRPECLEEEQLPLIIMLHEGAFIDKFTRKNSLLAENLCKNLARKGFATANIDYSSIKTDLELGTLKQGVQFINRAIHRAAQDGHAAISFFQQNADHFNINKKRIYLCGYSAGAITAINVAYYNPDKGDEAYSEKIFEQEGAMTRFAHYEEPKDAKLAGLISLAGAVSERNIIDKADQPKMKVMIVHSDDDMVLANGCGGIFDKYAEKNLKLEFPSISEELEIDINTDRITGKIRASITPALTVPASWVRGIRSALVDDFCGGKALVEQCENDGITTTFKQERKCGHALVCDKDYSINRRKYTKLVDAIARFASPAGRQSKKTNDRRNRRNRE